MLQRHTRYSAKKDIASEAYRVCQVLARRFKVHKNERTKWELRCRDCGKASCFQLYARPEVEVVGGGSEYWVIHNVLLKFECQPKPDNKSRSYYAVVTVLTPLVEQGSESNLGFCIGNYE
jgi:hypothetical protein